MNGYQRAVWIVSIINILFALVGIVVGVVVLLLGAGMLGESADEAILSGYVVSGFFIAAAVLGIIQSIYQLIVGCLGVRGSRDASKIGPFFVLTVINFIWAIVVFAFYLFNVTGGSSADLTTNVISSIINVIITAILMFCAGRIKSGQKFRDVC